MKGFIAKGLEISSNPLMIMVGDMGLEPMASGSGDQYLTLSLIFPSFTVIE